MSGTDYTLGGVSPTGRTWFVKRGTPTGTGLDDSALVTLRKAPEPASGGVSETGRAWFTLKEKRGAGDTGDTDDSSPSATFYNSACYVSAMCYSA